MLQILGLCPWILLVLLFLLLSSLDLKGIRSVLIYLPLSIIIHENLEMGRRYCVENLEMGRRRCIIENLEMGRRCVIENLEMGRRVSYRVL